MDYTRLNKTLPLYSSAAPLRKNLIVGYPITSYLRAKSSSLVASTLARGMPPDSLSCLAAFSYSGAKSLPEKGIEN